jgi:hypothetical protein
VVLEGTNDFDTIAGTQEQLNGAATLPLQLAELNHSLMWLWQELGIYTLAES